MRLLRIRKSPKPAKKFVAEFDDGRCVHFGATGYGDFTLYWRRDKDLARAKRQQYIARHAATEKWTNPQTPGTLSRFILWEKPTIEQAVRDYRKRFNV